MERPAVEQLLKFELVASQNNYVNVSVCSELPSDELLDAMSPGKAPTKGRGREHFSEGV